MSRSDRDNVCIDDLETPNPLQTLTESHSLSCHILGEQHISRFGPEERRRACSTRATKWFDALGA